MTDDHVMRKLASRRPEILERVHGRIFRFESEVDRCISKRKVEIDQQVLLLDSSWATKREMHARVVTPNRLLSPGMQTRAPSAFLWGASHGPVS